MFSLPQNYIVSLVRLFRMLERTPIHKFARHTQVDASNHRHFVLDSHLFFEANPVGWACLPEGLFPLGVPRYKGFLRGDPFPFPFHWVLSCSLDRVSLHTYLLESIDLFLSIARNLSCFSFALRLAPSCSSATAFPAGRTSHTHDPHHTRHTQHTQHTQNTQTHKHTTTQHNTQTHEHKHTYTTQTPHKHHKQHTNTTQTPHRHHTDTTQTSPPSTSPPPTHDNNTTTQQHTTTHNNTQQHTTTHNNTQQHTTTHNNTQQHTTTHNNTHTQHHTHTTHTPHTHTHTTHHTPPHPPKHTTHNTQHTTHTLHTLHTVHTIPTYTIRELHTLHTTHTPHVASLILHTPHHTETDARTHKSPFAGSDLFAMCLRLCGCTPCRHSWSKLNFRFRSCVLLCFA